MSSKNRSRNDRIRKRIDKLLDSSVDIDQIAVLMAQMPIGSKGIRNGSSTVLKKIVCCAMENAKKIQEARELVLTLC
jgi:hypothetical protein